jgi:putative hemolysin
MKVELLILFVVILFGLILCSFLGNGWVEGMTTNTTYYGPNGSTATFESNNSLVITKSNGTTVTYTASSTSANTYIGEDGGSVTVVTNADGTKSVVVKNPDGSTDTYTYASNASNTSNTSNTTNTSTTTNTYDNYNHYDQTSYPTIFYGPNGGTARVIKTANNNTIVITNKNGTTEIYYIDNNNDPSVSSYYGPNGGSAKIVTNNGQTYVEVTTPSGTKVVYNGNNINAYPSQDSTINQYDSQSNSTGTDYNSAYSSTTYYGQNGGTAQTVTGPAGNTYATYDPSTYYSSLPQGIPASQIPSGQEDLYILKSEVVPPVCPKCPDPVLKCPDKDDVTKCPPCPPCARCPEPAFDCKKVPNYSAFNPNYMPLPVLSDFSTFGM